MDKKRENALVKAFIYNFPSSVIVLCCGCLTAETLKAELIKYMKEP